jgi:hypothetical protein
LLQELPACPRRSLEERALRLLLRAFVTLNNCTWSDQTITLELGPAWGLPEGRRWDIYRWYPRPARLTVESGPFEKTASVSLRPFEVVLLEIVPAGTRPALDRSFENETAGRACGEPSRTVTLGIADAPAEKALPVPRENGLAAANPSALPPKRSVEVRCEVPPSKTGGLLVITLQMKRGEQDAPLANSGLYFAAAAEVLGAEVPCETIVPRGSFAAPWQGWRMAVGPSDGARSVQVLVTALIPADVALTWQGFFLPRKENP